MKPLASAALLVAVAAPCAARAQDAPRPGIELRADALLGTVDAYHAGAGLTVPMGYYVRLTTVGAYGVAREAATWQRSARADVLMRFLLDPFREHRYGLSAGGGISVRYDAGLGWRPFLAVVADLELPTTHAWKPALQVGLGGGARIGLVLRRGTARFR